MNKKIKNKSFKNKTINKKTKIKEKSVQKSKKNKIELNGKQNTEDLDTDLKQELNEIINDFKKTDSKPKKSKNKLSKVQSFNTLNDKNNDKTNELFVNQRHSFDPKTSDNYVKKRRKLMVRLETKWYEMRIFDDSVDLNAKQVKYSPQRVQELRREAQELLVKDIEVYQELQANNKSKREDFEWIRTVLRNGVLADKLSAHTVLIQDSAVHNLKSLEQIIGMVNTKGKRECIMALDNLRELFIGDLLIPNKKLKTFTELLHFFNDKEKEKKLRNSRLIMCLFEEQLKSLYRIFLDSLAKVSHDSVETTKHKSLTTFFDLLVNNGEQEQYLLENLVNKLGDPLSKLAAQSTHLLNQLINQYHPQMKTVVVDEVERLLYRPNIGQRAQYYGLCFLSEVIFGADDRPLANKLIKLYFSFFKSSIKRGEIENKMMSVLLSGVSRAFPYSKLETNLLEEHLQTFYKLIHFVNPNTSIQALLLIFNIIDGNQSGLLTDRFYSVLYRHIVESELDQCSRKAMFLNLIFRAMKKDPILRRVKAFIKRLLQIALTTSSSLATAILILISEVIKSKPGLMLAKEVKEVVKQSEDDDEDEHYEDMPMSDEEGVEQTNGQTVAESEEPKSSGISWLHNKNNDTNRTKTKHYDINARNPMFCGVESEELWEMDLMRHHFHPSTNLFALKILTDEPIDYSGDPMTDFTVKHFLDRFVFRNPKKSDQKSKGNKVFGRFAPTDDTQTPVPLNSKEYVNQLENKIPIDERFIYNYLKQKKSLTKTDGYDSDVDSVTSLEFESLLDRMEPMSKKDRNLDFAKDLYKDSNKKSNKRKAKSDESSDDESDDEFGGELSAEDDDDVQFDADDPEFADAFDGVDSELEDALEEKEESEDIPEKSKKGFDRMTSDLFASADEFSQLLEANELSDSDMSAAEGDQIKDRKTELRVKRKLSRNKGKKKFINKQDLDL